MKKEKFTKTRIDKENKKFVLIIQEHISGVRALVILSNKKKHTNLVQMKKMLMSNSGKKLKK